MVDLDVYLEGSRMLGRVRFMILLSQFALPCIAAFLRKEKGRHCVTVAFMNYDAYHYTNMSVIFWSFIKAC